MTSRYPREEALKSHYAANLTYYSSNIQQMLANIGYTDLPDVTSILDVGCGDGRACAALAKLAPAAAIVGIDYCEGRILLARQSIGESDRMKFVHADIHDFVDECLKNNTHYDLVICNEVLEHLEDPRALLDKLQKVTKWVVGSLPINLPYKAHLVVYPTISAIKQAFPEFSVAKMGEHTILEWKGAPQ